MWLDNYNNPNNVDSKVLVKQMIKLKNSILKLKIKIKYYKKYEPDIKYRKKHKLYIERFQTKLNNTKNHMKKIKKYIMKIMMIKIMVIKIMMIKIVMMKIKK